MNGAGLVSRYARAVNFNERAGGQAPSILLMHYTGMDSAQKACDWLCCERSGVSCHYLVAEDGSVVQMVDEDKRAWHAGAGSWHGAGDINSRSIGIEIHNRGHFGGYPDFPGAQMQAVIKLSKDILQRHVIAPEMVLGHSDIAPGRKIDPGEKFNWRALHNEGIGHFVEPVQITGGSGLSQGDEGHKVQQLQERLARYGYGVDASGRFDEATAAAVKAFQMHFFQQRVDGVACRSAIATLDALIAGLTGPGDDLKS